MMYSEDILKELDKLDNRFNILEKGPYKLSLVKCEDIIDISDDFKKHFPIETSDFIKWDCSKVPYHIKNKQYDLVCISGSRTGYMGNKDRYLRNWKEYLKRL